MRRTAIIEPLLKGAAVVAITIMLATVLLQIAGRHILPSAPPWTEELGRLILIWLTAIGAGLALKLDGYRGAVEALADLLPFRGRRALNIGFMLMIGGFLLVFLFYSYHAVMRNVNVTMSALGISVSYFYLGMLAMAALLLWGLGHVLVAELRLLARGHGRARDGAADEASGGDGGR